MILQHTIEQDEPLYSSNKDIGAPDQQIAEFQAEPSPNIVINEAPKSQVPVYAQTEIPVKVVQTINSDNIPTVVSSQQVIVNTDLLTQMYPTAEAAQIISDLQNDVPLSQQTAEQVVTSGIITSVNQEQPQPEPVVKKRKKKKTGIINGITNFVYNLLYKSK